MRSLTLAALVLALPGPLTAGAIPMQGVQLDDIDRGVSPCNDFYQFANGAWRAGNPIPASMTRWSRRWQAGEAAKERLKGILDEVSAVRTWPAGSPEQLIGDHYGACMDAARADALGVKPIQPLLDEIEALRDGAQLQAMLRRFHDLGFGIPFRLASTPDNHDPARVIADVAASGLGLPDRDYYFKDEPRFREARDKYRAFVAQLFELAGRPKTDARRAADTVFAFETSLAEASLDNVALRDPQATDHKTTFADLQKLTPRFDWASYFDAAGLPRADLNVQEPLFLKAVDTLLERAPLATWKTYLQWNLLNNAASDLSSPFAEADFDFYGRFLGGTTEMKPRWKRCAESTDRWLGEALGRKYVEKYFPPEAKTRMQALVKNLLTAMGEIIRGLDWMGPETKGRALEKLATFNPKVGYPDKWIDYSSVSIRRDTYWNNLVAARRFAVQDDRNQIGKPVDRGRWGLTPPTSDAYYNPLLNEIVFPAGILQPPAFSLDAIDAVNYGAIGVVIGHEISHGFDDQGAQYDAQGRLRNWWTEADLKKFQERGQCVVDQFEGYFVEPGLHHNGKLVLGEAIGDLAGAKIAYRAFKNALAKQGDPGPLDGFTQDQQFFIAWGQFRGDAIRPETQRAMIQGDPHPIAKYRVIGPVSNLPDFQQAFACPADAPMVRPQGKRCEVW
jgi:endothelin-converting enzyme/putative endopeptidase